MRAIRALKLIAALLICQLAGFIGSIFTRTSVQTWYVFLRKPAFTPPDRVFAPVWTALFLMMGAAAFLVWDQAGTAGREKVDRALGAFACQLALNVSWSLVFFGLRSPGGAFAVILILWAAIFWTMARFRQISRPAALLLLPYLLWVSFASVLNAAIFLLN